MIKSIRWYVYLVAFILTVVPSAVGFYTLHGILSSAVSIGLNQRVLDELDASGDRLKELAKLSKRSPEKQIEYRTKFEELQKTRESYGILLNLEPYLRRSYFQVFALVFGVALAIASLFAFLLNRKIIRSHQNAARELLATQKKNAYLENKESWSLLAQKMVHEIKNPLTPIQLMTGRLASQYEKTHSSQNSDFKQILKDTSFMINEELFKMNKWIDSFAQYAKLPEPKLETIDLYKLLLQFTAQYQSQSNSTWSNIDLTIEKNADSRTSQAPFMISADAVLLKQVFFNLVKNSSETSESNEAKIYVQFSLGRIEEKGNGRVVLTVSDNGPGLPEKIKKYIFKPYMSTKSKEKGMGLGLAVVKKVLTEHGAEISLLDTHKGCTFEITFPAA